MSSDTKHTYTLDKTAAEYYVEYDGKNHTVSKEEIEQDLALFEEEFDSCKSWNNQFFKTHWSKFTKANLEKSVIFKGLFTPIFGPLKDVELDVVNDNANNKLTISVTQDGKTKTVTVSREDLGENGVDGCNLTVKYDDKVLVLSNVKVSQDATTKEVTIEADSNVSGLGKLKLQFTKTKATLLDGATKVAEAENTADAYVAWVSVGYYNKLMEKLNVSINPVEDIQVTNIYVPNGASN